MGAILSLCQHSSRTLKPSSHVFAVKAYGRPVQTVSQSRSVSWTEKQIKLPITERLDI